MIPPIEEWKPSPVDYGLGWHAVHVWRAFFQPALVCSRRFTESLSEEEIAKARRFVRPLDRERYIFAHALLRSILGAYVGCPPRQLILEKDQYGKPFLISGNSGRDIQFNLSHSGDIALVAVARGARVGIDVEWMRSVPDARQIVNSLFSIGERELLSPLSPPDFDKEFFDYWTSKEAFIKGIGKGLSYALDKFSVILTKGESHGLIRVHDSPTDDCRWKIVRTPPAPGYSGALAVEEVNSQPRFFHLDTDLL
jgi:4'-phosphopantetheinyl transferase